MTRPSIAPVKFVRRHKVVIAIVGTAAICTYLNRQTLAMHNEFLKDNGLYETFYAKV